MKHCVSRIKWRHDPVLRCRVMTLCLCTEMVTISSRVFGPRDKKNKILMLTIFFSNGDMRGWRILGINDSEHDRQPWDYKWNLGFFDESAHSDVILIRWYLQARCPRSGWHCELAPHRIRLRAPRFYQYNPRWVEFSGITKYSTYFVLTCSDGSRISQIESANP